MIIMILLLLLMKLIIITKIIIIAQSQVEWDVDEPGVAAVETDVAWRSLMESCLIVNVF